MQNPIPTPHTLPLSLPLPFPNLIPHRRVVERDTHRPAMVSVVLPDDTLTAQLPQPGIVVTARGNEIGAVGAKGAVPDPALVAVQGGLEGEGSRVALGGRGQGVAGLDVVGRGEVDGPDARGVVGGAGGEVAHVWGQ